MSCERRESERVVGDVRLLGITVQHDLDERTNEKTIRLETELYAL